MGHLVQSMGDTVWFGGGGHLRRDSQELKVTLGIEDGK